MSEDANKPNEELPPQKQADGTFAPGNTLGQKFAPGESGNPGGLPVGTEKPGIWAAALSGMTDEELQAIVKDPKVSRSKRSAARFWLATGDENLSEARKTYAEMLDRAEGKAVGREQVEHKGGVSIEIVTFKESSDQD